MTNPIPMTLCDERTLLQRELYRLMPRAFRKDEHCRIIQAPGCVRMTVDMFSVDQMKTLIAVLKAVKDA